MPIAIMSRCAIIGMRRVGFRRFACLENNMSSSQSVCRETPSVDIVWIHARHFTLSGMWMLVVGVAQKDKGSDTSSTGNQECKEY